MPINDVRRLLEARRARAHLNRWKQPLAQQPVRRAPPFDFYTASRSRIAEFRIPKTGPVPIINAAGVDYSSDDPPLPPVVIPLPFIDADGVDYTPEEQPTRYSRPVRPVVETVHQPSSRPRKVSSPHRPATRPTPVKRRTAQRSVPGRTVPSTTHIQGPVIVPPFVQKLRDKWRAAKPSQTAAREGRGHSPLNSRPRLAHVPHPVIQQIVKPHKNSLGNFNLLPNTISNGPKSTEAPSVESANKITKNVQQNTRTTFSQPLHSICIPVPSVDLPTLQELVAPWNNSPEEKTTKSNALQFCSVRIRPLAITYPTLLWPATDDKVLFLQTRKHVR